MENRLDELMKDFLSGNSVVDIHSQYDADRRVKEKELSEKNGGSDILEITFKDNYLYKDKETGEIKCNLNELIFPLNVRHKHHECFSREYTTYSHLIDKNYEDVSLEYINELVNKYRGLYQSNSLYQITNENVDNDGVSLKMVI
jgi:hypothetical protein